MWMTERMSRPFPLTSSSDSPFSPASPPCPFPSAPRLRCLPSWGPTGRHPAKPHLCNIVQVRPSINGENLILWGEKDTNEHSKSPNIFWDFPA